MKATTHKAAEAHATAKADALRLARLALRLLEASPSKPNWADAGDMNRLRADLYDAVAPHAGLDDWDEVLDARKSWAAQIDKIEKATNII